MKARVAVLASLFSLGLVAFAAAQVSTTTGTVVSNSGGMLVVSTDSGQKTFMVDAQSSVPESLATGTRVTVEYHTLANDKLHAFKVTPMGTSPTSTASNTTSATDTTSAPPTDTEMASPAPAPTSSPMAAAPTTQYSSPAPAPTSSPTTNYGNTTSNPSTYGNTTSTTTTDTTNTRADDNTSTTGRRRLPATASPLPLLALAGTLALAGGALLRRRRA